MKLLPILAFALAVADFAAGMPTSTDANKSSNSNKNNNSTLDKNYLLAIEDSNSTLNNNDNDTLIIKDSNGTNGTIENNEISGPEAERLANNSILRTAQGRPLPMSLPKDLFNEFKCIGAERKYVWPRMSLQFKGYCEEEYGRCFLRALREYGAIADNWQCWKRDDGWWQADYTHIDGFQYMGLDTLDDVLNTALAEVIGYDPHCTYD